MADITTVGLDLAKQVFQVHGVDADGATVVRKQLRRAQLLALFVPSASGKARWVSSSATRSSLLIGITGAQLAATFDRNGLPELELCLNGGHDVKPPPGEPAKPENTAHCLFCVAGAHVALAHSEHPLGACLSFNGDVLLAAAIDFGVRLISERSNSPPRGPPVNA